MNQLFIVIVALVAFTYFGGSNVPNVLKNNKQVLLGVLIGLVLGSFFGVSVEGFDCSAQKKKIEAACCKGDDYCEEDKRGNLKFHVCGTDCAPMVSQLLNNCQLDVEKKGSTGKDSEFQKYAELNALCVGGGGRAGNSLRPGAIGAPKPGYYGTAFAGRNLSTG